jgi:hypothetical protein
VKKILGIFAVTIIVLLASQTFLHLETSDTYSGSVIGYWVVLAKNAWKYFQPGKGVNAVTGLHYASLGWPYFTDWDLGLYIQTIIDAEKLGILSGEGAWGANARLDKILTFLETRELNNDGLPFWWYEAGTGHKSGNGSPDVVDTGKLLVALHNLKLYKSGLADRVDHIVYEKTNYTSMWNEIYQMSDSASIYAYYVVTGFASFWPEKFSSVAESILNKTISAPKIVTYNVELPSSDILCDPLIYSVFDLEPDARLLNLAKQVYLAHEARYNATGKYVAFSEGNTALDQPSFVYEWVVLSDGRTWVVRDQAFSDVKTSPIIYLKVAVSFLAIYNTGFAQNMTDYLIDSMPPPTNGYLEGVDENGRIVQTSIDKTNGLIISAARYAVENYLHVSSWQKGNLIDFPWPFVQGGAAKNVTVVIGETKLHGPVGGAQSTDTIGGMIIMERLARESSNGNIMAALDSWLIEYDSNSGNVSLLSDAMNMITVGSPAINLLSYYFNSLKNQLGGPLIPVQFIYGKEEKQNCLFVPISGSVYKMDFDEQGKLLADYSVIMAFHDQFGHYVIIVYGLGAGGTIGACQVLRDFDQYNLSGSAVIIKSTIPATGVYPSNSSIVEVVP